MLTVFERLVSGSRRHFGNAVLTGERRGRGVILRPSELLVAAFCYCVCKSILNFSEVRK